MVIGLSKNMKPRITPTIIQRLHVLREANNHSFWSTENLLMTGENEPMGCPQEKGLPWVCSSLAELVKNNLSSFDGPVLSLSLT